MFRVLLVALLAGVGCEPVEEIQLTDDGPCDAGVVAIDAPDDSGDTVDAAPYTGDSCPIGTPTMTNELVGSCYWQWCLDGHYSLQAKPDGVPCVKSVGLPSSGANWELSQCAHGACGLVPSGD